MYALAIMPLVRKLQSRSGDVTQIWYADDAAATGKLIGLQTNLGPKFGYFVNPTNTWLITKEDQLFANTGVQVTSEAAIGTKESYVKDKVVKWSAALDNLATIAVTQPHAAYTALFTHGFSNQWTYLSRTMSGIDSLLESIIRTKLIPKITGQPPPNDELRDILALPARLGGMALTNPTQASDAEFYTSVKPLKNAIIQQSALLKCRATRSKPEAKCVNRNEKQANKPRKV